MDRRRSRRLIVAAACAGLLVRLCFGLLYWTGKPLTQDEREYLAIAGNLADGHGFTYPDSHETGTGQRFARAPGYPVFLALLNVRTAPSAPVRVKVLQSVFGAVVIVLLAAIARAAAGEAAGVIAAFLAAFYPPLVWLPAYVFSEALFMPLAL